MYHFSLLLRNQHAQMIHILKAFYTLNKDRQQHNWRAE